jgi:hypothetical protein
MNCKRKRPLSLEKRQLWAAAEVKKPAATEVEPAHPVEEAKHVETPAIVPKPKPRRVPSVKRQVFFPCRSCRAKTLMQMDWLEDSVHELVSVINTGARVSVYSSPKCHFDECVAAKLCEYTNADARVVETGSLEDDDDNLGAQQLRSLKIWISAHNLCDAPTSRPKVIFVRSPRLLPKKMWQDLLTMCTKCAFITCDSIGEYSRAHTMPHRINLYEKTCCPRPVQSQDAFLNVFSACDRLMAGRAVENSDALQFALCNATTMPHENILHDMSSLNCIDPFHEDYALWSTAFAKHNVAKKSRARGDRPWEAIAQERAAGQRQASNVHIFNECSALMRFGTGRDELLLSAELARARDVRSAVSKTVKFSVLQKVSKQLGLKTPQRQEITSWTIDEEVLEQAPKKLREHVKRLMAISTSEAVEFALSKCQKLVRRL